jgi:uncharacterized membrane protein
MEPAGLPEGTPILYSESAVNPQALQTDASKAVLGKLTLHDGRDPFTPPLTKVDWVASSIPWVKAPRVQKRWMNSKIVLVIEGPSGQDIQDQFRKCLASAALSGLLAGLVTAYVTTGVGGVSAGLTTFMNTLKSCLDAALKKDIDNISARIESSSGWDPNWS